MKMSITPPSARYIPLMQAFEDARIHGSLSSHLRYRDRFMLQVVCAIIERDCRFLAACRAAGSHNAGLWEFPGGKINAGETPEGALHRELLEELGIRVTLTGRLQERQHRYPAFVIRLIPFRCTLAEGEPFPHEHAEVRWLTPAEALLLPWSPADIPVLKEYCSMASSSH